MEWTLKESCHNDFTIWKPDPHRKTEDEIADRIYELKRLIERCNRYGEPSATTFIKSQLEGLEWVLEDSNRMSYERGRRYLKNQENKECKD
ncbi:hypothetical protein LI82_08820 [Methanococcoides methylutens]|uniref:Uncharacterized protein n=1 Tax=Methanococcoides methylutens TaxID=2226 RepID=A0A099T0W4_METMT|nr:hypothetical protein LI82_08820 [Methanococcoides methylutens]